MKENKNYQFIEVHLWGQMLGVIAWDKLKHTSMFQFEENFKYNNALVAPILMPFPKERINLYGPFRFLKDDTFEGLPPMIADSLPDHYGNIVLQEYLKRKKNTQTFTPTMKLSYMGTRAMGALEYYPSEQREELPDNIELTELANISNQIFESELDENKITVNQLVKLFMVGTSVGGARPKALVSYNFNTKEFTHSYQHHNNYTPLIVKFDKINEQLEEPMDYGRIEYIYHKMAVSCGIKMTPCGFFNTKDGGSHFYTHRFDRTNNGEKIHMQTLAAITGKNPREIHDYSMVYDTILKLNLGYNALEQQFRRMVFNYYSANVDCHLKNISFLMSKDGHWSLSPAYDITFPYSYNKIWMKPQPILINGKGEHITTDDFKEIADNYGVKRPEHIIKEIKASIAAFPELSEKHKLPAHKSKPIFSEIQKFLVTSK